MKKSDIFKVLSLRELFISECAKNPPVNPLTERDLVEYIHDNWDKIDVITEDPTLDDDDYYITPEYLEKL